MNKKKIMTCFGDSILATVFWRNSIILSLVSSVSHFIYPLALYFSFVAFVFCLYNTFLLILRLFFVIPSFCCCFFARRGKNGLWICWLVLLTLSYCNDQIPHGQVPHGHAATLQEALQERTSASIRCWELDMSCKITACMFLYIWT